MFDKIKKLLIDAANVDEKKITPNAKLKEDLGFDSLYAVEMALELETDFNIQIDSEELKNIVTVQDVCDLVTKKLKEKK